jgi:hypothetical protein
VTPIQSRPTCPSCQSTTILSAPTPTLTENGERRFTWSCTTCHAQGDFTAIILPNTMTLTPSDWTALRRRQPRAGVWRN